MAEGKVGMAIYEIAGIALVILAGLAVYFLPTLIAAYTRNINFAAIFALDLLAGWTFAGWLIALVWSLKRK